MTLLSMVQGASDMISVARPSSVIGSTNANARAMLALANQGGLDLCRAGEWRLLTSEHTFTTVADSAQGSSALPSNFARFVNGTIWNRTQDRELFPLDGQYWQQLRATGAVSTITDFFRLRGSTFLMAPTPSAGDTIAYEYISNEFCQSSLGTAQSVWTADTDTGVLDEYLLQLDLIWRFKQSKGLEYAEDMQNFELRKEALLSADRPAPVLSLHSSGRMWRSNVPEGNFPS